MPEPVLPPARYEESDVPARAVFIAFPTILIALLATVVLVRWIYPHTTVDHRLPTKLPTFPSPRLQVAPAADMEKFHAAELDRLNNGGWDDQAKGVRHIPI